MGRLSMRVLTIISFFTMFSATSCKNTKGGLKGYFFEPQIVERAILYLELIGFRVMFQSASQTIRNTFL